MSIKEEKRSPQILMTDKIAIISLIVNIILAVFTYLLFKETTLSTGIANEAVQEAKRANDISQENYILAKEEFDESKKSEMESSELANKSLNTQINAIKENQRQFSISNEPLLNIASSEIEIFEANKPLVSRMKVENLGKFPCKVIDCKTVTAIRKTSPPFDEVFKVAPNYSDILNKYILNDNPVPSPFGTDVLINERQIELVNNENYFIYTTGYIKYKNIINNKIKTYRFQLKMKPGYETQHIINENI